MANHDVYLPLAGWLTAPMSNECVGVKLTWALSAGDLQAGRMEVAKLHLSADQAEELAASLLHQSAMSKQRRYPN
jgi:hypothetical protein